MNSSIQDKVMDIKFMELDIMMEMVDYKYRMNKLNAEIKVLTENGTYDDLMYLYEEAENEQKEEKKGVISTVIDAIKTVINTIIETITGFFNKEKKENKDPNEEVEVNKEDYENTENFIKDFDNVKNKISNPGSILEDGVDDLENSMKGLLKYFAFGGAAAAAGTAVMINITRSKRDETGQRLNSISTLIKDSIDKIKDIPFLGNIVNIIEKIVNGIKTALQRIGIIGNNDENKNGNNGENNEEDEGLPTKIPNNNYNRFINEVNDDVKEQFDTIDKYKALMPQFKQILDQCIQDIIQGKIGMDNDVNRIPIDDKEVKDRFTVYFSRIQRDEQRAAFKNIENVSNIILENFNIKNEIQIVKNKFNNGKLTIKNDAYPMPKESEMAMVADKKFYENYKRFKSIAEELHFAPRYQSIENYNSLRSIYTIQKVQKVELNNPKYPPDDWIRQELNDIMRNDRGKIPTINNNSNNELYHKLDKDAMNKYNDYVKWMKKEHPNERATVINFLATNGDYFRADNQANQNMDAIRDQWMKDHNMSDGPKGFLQGIKNKLFGNKN